MSKHGYIRVLAALLVLVFSFSSLGQATYGPPSPVQEPYRTSPMDGWEYWVKGMADFHMMRGDVGPEEYEASRAGVFESMNYDGRDDDGTSYIETDKEMTDILNAERQRERVRDDWVGYHMAVERKRCAVAYLEKIKPDLMGGYIKPFQFANAEKLLDREDFNPKKYAWVFDLDDSIDKEWFDLFENRKPTSPELNVTCKAVEAAIETQIVEAMLPKVVEFFREVFGKKNPLKGQRTNEELHADFYIGLGKSILDLRKVPGALWGKTLDFHSLTKGWFSGDKATHERVQRFWADKRKEILAWIRDPEKEIKEFGEAAEEAFYHLTAEDIGYITGIIELAVVGEKIIEKTVWAKVSQRLAMRSQRYRRALEKLAELKGENTRLRAEVYRDPMTGILNRKVLDEIVPDFLALAAAEKRHVTMLLMDLDDFAAFNTIFNYGVGDDAIIDFTRRVRNFRNSDHVIRLGGEEIVVLLENTTLKGAEKIVKDIQDLIHNSEVRRKYVGRMTDLHTNGEITPEVMRKSFKGNGFPEHGNIGTVSIGVTELDWTKDTWETLKNRANAMLDLAKKKPGKQGWVIADRSGEVKKANFDVASALQN